MSPLNERISFREGKTRFGFAIEVGMADKRQSGSHKTLAREGWPDVVFAFHESEEIGPRMLERLAKHTGLTPNDH